MRHALKILTVLGLAGLCAFGFMALKDTPEMQKLLPSNDPVVIDKAPKPSSETNEEKDPDALPKFEAPTLTLGDETMDKNIKQTVYLHENGFEVGKTNYKDVTTSPNVSYDNKGRLLRFAVRITDETKLMYTSAPSDSAFTQRTLAKDAPDVQTTDHTWRYALHPYMNALTDYVSKNKTDVIIVVELQYRTDNDKIPHYIDLKAFSEQDLGKGCNVWTTFYNYDPARQVDYVSASWLGQSDG